MGRELADAAFRKHGAQIYRYLFSRTGDHHEAEELAQGVFADLVDAIAQADRAPRSMLAWLYAVAERRYVDELRRRKRRGRPETLSNQDVDVRALSYGPSLAIALRQALERQPLAQRQVVILRVFQEKSFREIAALVGSSEAACKMRFSRAIRQLRDDLNREGLDP